jgi:hypothetical protein
MIWPLLAGAFLLQLVSPLIFQNHYFLIVLCDNLADVLLACIILFSLPYHKIQLKLLAMVFTMWNLFVLINNAAVEFAIEPLRKWQIIGAILCVAVGSFMSGAIVELHNREKDY